MSTTRQPQANNHPTIENAQQYLTRRAGELSTKPARKLIGKPLSNYHAETRAVLLKSADGDGETYHRSEHSHLKALGVHSTFFAPAIESTLVNGKKAHFGAYANSIERMGDTLVLATEPKQAVSGNAKNYNAQLDYKNKICQQIAAALTTCRYLTVRHTNQYPCVMIEVARTTLPASCRTGLNVSDKTREEWVNFLMSALVGIINAGNLKHNVKLEVTRRSSFGFSSTTFAPTDECMRLNVGLIPREEIRIIIDSIAQLDALLTQMSANPASIPKLSVITPPLFYGTAAHLNYLNGKYPPKPNLNIIELLWQQTEKTGKSTLTNLMRTSAARNAVAANVYNSLAAQATLANSFYQAVQFSESMQVITGGKKPTLSYQQRPSQVMYQQLFTNQAFISADQAFIELMLDLLTDIEVACEDDTVILATIADIKKSLNHGDLSYFHAKLELINELIFIRSIQHADDGADYSGYGSDSDTEDMVDEVPIFSKKIIVSNGMRAIVAGLKCIEKTNLSILARNCYYEVNLLLSDYLQDFKNVEIQDAKVTSLESTADVIIHDLNPCATTAAMANVTAPFVSTNNKTYIIDTTSATTTACQALVRGFAASRSTIMLFAASGLKNEQNGADKNSYGTLRIFAKSRNQCDSTYRRLTNQDSQYVEKPVKSSVSHAHRRMMKRAGMVPTAQSYFG